MNFEMFIEVYDKQLHGMARAILRRWKTPIAVGEEDVVQELHLGAWIAMNRYDQDRGGMTKAAYAMCSARLYAQGWVHEQRNANRRRGTAAGRFPKAFSQFTPEHTVVNYSVNYDSNPSKAPRGESPGFLNSSVLPGQEAAVEFNERLRIALAGCVDSREREVFSVLFDECFDIDAASVRLEKSFKSAKRARAQVRSTAQRMEQL